MKKINLLFLAIFMFMLVPSVYAANTVDRISNIKIPPLLTGKKYVYINNMKDYSVKINDTNNFKTLKNNNDWSWVVIYKLSPGTKTYNNPYEIYWNKIGYYVDDNGKPVYLDAKVTINKIVLKWVDGLSTFDDSNYYEVTNVRNNGFELVSNAIDNEFEVKNSDTGIHSTFTFSLYNEDGSKLDDDIAKNLYLQWNISDLDVGDHTITRNEQVYDYQGQTPEYVESIKFNTGFDSKFYVLNDSVLKILANNSKYAASEATGGEGLKSVDYSTVLAYQTNTDAEAEWWGCECGTFIAAVSNQYPYPTLNDPIKSADKKEYKAGDKVSYMINENFPYTDSHSKAKSIELSDSFDKALNISEMTYKVLDANGKDVTGEWKKNVSGQTVTLKYTGEDATTVYGKFTFKFSDLRVLDPDSSHEVKKENGVEYKIIPNKAKVTIVGANDDTSTKETNIVKIRVGEITNPQTGMKTTMIIGIIMTIIVGSISMYYFMNKKRIHLK